MQNTLCVTCVKKLLTSYAGSSIIYDGMGNPLNYRNGITMTWERGRLLKTFTKGSNTYGYLYDANGLRASKFKVVSGTDTDVYKYFYDDNSNLVYYETPYGDLYFIYDENDDLIGVRVISGSGEATYNYIKNLQGDITMITNNEGQIVAVYEYDVYGMVESVKNALGATITSSSHIGLLNPIRYRGYCYDNETGLYYLISRYYDPTTGRFVNADNPAYLGSNGTATSFNLYSYCECNPLNNVDYAGTDAYWLHDRNDANGFGHTSLLLQDKKGKWWYFYWGDFDIQLLYFGGNHIRQLNEFLHINGYRKKTLWYTIAKRIKGNFTKSLKYACTLVGIKEPSTISLSKLYKGKYKNTNYYLHAFNCVQVSIRVLLKGSFKCKLPHFSIVKQQLLTQALLLNPVPNIVYAYLTKTNFFMI